MDEAQQRLTRKERKLLKRQEKDARRSAESKTRMLQKAAFWGFGILVIAGVGFVIWSLQKNSQPQGADRSTAIPIQGRDHIPVGGAHEPYNSNPPTSGTHYDSPARLGAYDRELPDEQIVHNLEHGEIWISYHPRINAEAVAVLKGLVGPRVILAPRSANDTDIALAAWGRLDAFNIGESAVDAQRIRDFIERYKNKGPENVDSNTMAK